MRSSTSIGPRCAPSSRYSHWSRRRPSPLAVGRPRASAAAGFGARGTPPARRRGRAPRTSPGRHRRGTFIGRRRSGGFTVAALGMTTGCGLMTTGSAGCPPAAASARAQRGSRPRAGSGAPGLLLREDDRRGELVLGRERRGRRGPCRRRGAGAGGGCGRGGRAARRGRRRRLLARRACGRAPRGARCCRSARRTSPAVGGLAGTGRSGRRRRRSGAGLVRLDPDRRVGTRTVTFTAPARPGAAPMPSAARPPPCRPRRSSAKATGTAAS